MQWPRRTSEFLEDPGTATKRQSRLIPPSRFTTSIGQTPIGKAPTRNSTKQTALITGSASHSVRAAPTPQQTPMTLTKGKRVLFSAEKKRNASAVALHNDKKWIQDQTQRISDYLRNAFYPGAIENVNEDFFSRNNCLKQMTIKQFVGIINYFLQFIAGNRLKVGSNYVEDIVNILQKINYPYAVNKSWLKTPTHSLGNLVVMFDYFMNFVTLPNDNDEFELEEDATDLEFKMLLLENCQASFQLWDKNLEKDLEQVKHQTANHLMQKRHGINGGFDDVQAEIAQLMTVYKQLENNRPYIDPEVEMHCQQIRQQVREARAHLEQLVDSDGQLTIQLDQMLQLKTKLGTNVAELSNKINAYQMAIKRQECSTQDRDAYVEKIKTLRLELESKQRTMQELQSNDEIKQVELANAQKKVTDQIENINARLRDLFGILGITDDEQQFYISMKADAQTISRLRPLIQQLRGKLQLKLQNFEKELQQYQEEIKDKNLLKFSKLQPEFEAKQKAYEKAKNKLEKFEQHSIEELKVLYAKKQEIENQRNSCKSEIEELQQQLERTRQDFKQLEQENEEKMAQFEEEHNALASARRQRLDAARTNLNECFQELNAINELISRNNNVSSNFAKEN